jgi:hypothetical protein
VDVSSSLQYDEDDGRFRLGGGGSWLEGGQVGGGGEKEEGGEEGRRGERGRTAWIGREGQGLVVSGLSRPFLSALARSFTPFFGDPPPSPFLPPFRAVLAPSCWTLRSKDTIVTVNSFLLVFCVLSSRRCAHARYSFPSSTS